MEYTTETETKTKSSNTNLIIIGILSSIIGGLIVYYLLKSKLNTEQTFSFASANNSSQIENRLFSIEQKLQQLQSITIQSQSH